MSEENKKVEDASFVVEIQQEPGCRLKLKVHVKPSHVKQCYKKAVRKVNKQISIPGFRKGKAPDASVIKKYGSYVDQEWKESTMHDALDAGLQMSKIYPLQKGSLEKPKMESCSEEEGANFVFSYEHYPILPNIDFSRLSLPAIPKEAVSEEKVDEVVLQIKKAHADFEEIEGRAVKESDYVDLTIDAIDHDPPSSIVKDRRFPVEQEVMAPWMIKVLVGLKPGDEVEALSETDEKMSIEEKKNFKPTKVRIKLHSIKKILLPELNDELAEKIGVLSKEDLIEKIRSNLEKEAEENQRQKRVEALEEALLSSYPLDLPASIVESEKEARLKERLRLLKAQKLSDEELKMREKEITQEVTQEAEKTLRLFFLNKQLANQGKISLSKQELNEELVRQISTNPAYQRQDLSAENSKELISRLSSSLLQRKTRDWALSQVLENSLT
ncbi:MAG: trigger factor [Chlamydiales bacterium]